MTNSHFSRAFWRSKIFKHLAIFILLAGTSGIVATAPVSASMNIGPNVCEVVFSMSTYPTLTLIAEQPCQPGQNTCDVLLQGGNLPYIVSQTFNGQCDTLAQSTILAFASFADTQYASCTGLASAPCAISNLLKALSAPNVVGTLIQYLGGALSLPFYSQNGISAWLTAAHQNALWNIYVVMATLGVMVALLAGAFRLVAEGVKKGAAPGMLIVGVPIRIIVATAVIAGFFGFAKWAIGLFNNLASGVFHVIANQGVTQVFANCANPKICQPGTLSAAVQAALAGAGLAGLLGVIVIMIMMLYLFIMLILRDVVLAFAIVLAPIAIGLAVFDYRNEMFSTWKNLFIGGLLMSLAGAVGIGVSFAIFASLIQVASGFDWFFALVMLVGGLFMTTRLMNAVMRGSMSHRSPTSLLFGMGEGAIIGMGIRKAIGAGSSAVKGRVAGKPDPAAPSATRAQANATAGVAAASASMSGSEAGPAPEGSVLSAASLTTQVGLKSVPSGALETALMNDEGAQQIIAKATANLHPGTSMQARLQTMATSDIHRPVLNRLIENGVGKGQLISGVEPHAVKFAYSDDELEVMTNMADQAARTAQAREIKK